MVIDQQVFEAGKWLYQQMEQLGMKVPAMHQECFELGQRSFNAFFGSSRKTPMQLAKLRINQLKKKSERKLAKGKEMTQ